MSSRLVLSNHPLYGTGDLHPNAFGNAQQIRPEQKGGAAASPPAPPEHKGDTAAVQKYWGRGQNPHGQLPPTGSQAQRSAALSPIPDSETGPQARRPVAQPTPAAAPRANQQTRQPAAQPAPAAASRANQQVPRPAAQPALAASPQTGKRAFVGHRPQGQGGRT